MSLTLLIYISVTAMGVAAALTGTFVHYRGRTLLSDVTAHATLPGVAIGFLVALALDINGGRSLPIMLGCAAGTAFIAGLCVQMIEHYTRLGRDVAIASVLSVFYGAGITLLSYIQRLEHAAQAGLESFLLGQITGITAPDALTITFAAFIIGGATLFLARQFSHICFDEIHAKTLGINTHIYDTVLNILMIGVVCIGIRTLGVILVLALLIIPPVTARLWSAQLPRLLCIAAFIGALSCLSGAMLSTHLDNMPAGGTIVLCAATLFLASLLVDATFARGKA